MDKITHSSKNITPFGGLNFIYQAMNRMGLDKFINEQLGFRSVLAQYSYSDIVYSLFGNALTQGSFVADLEVLKEKYSKQVFNKIPSPDTVEYVCQELKTSNIIKYNAFVCVCGFNLSLNAFFFFFFFYIQIKMEVLFRATYIYLC